MRKAGWFSFVYYLLYALGGWGTVVYNYIAIQKLNAEGGGLEGLGLALLLVIGIVFGVAGLLGVILKLIHMKSGWILFGLLCIVLDIAMIAVFVSSMIKNGYSGESLLAIPFILLSAVSAIANIKSLSD